jgi:hypothetical protein
MGTFITKQKNIFQKLTEKYDFVVVPILAEKYYYPLKKYESLLDL